jgi:hypothetical protein
LLFEILLRWLESVPEPHPFPAVFVYQTVSGPARFYDTGGW